MRRSHVIAAAMALREADDFKIDTWSREVAADFGKLIQKINAVKESTYMRSIK